MNYKKSLKYGLFFVLIFIFIIYKFIFPVYYVPTDSMEPTIHKNSYIIVSRFHYKFFEINRNDIVLFNPVEKIFEKGIWTHRVIATEGDNISVKNNETHVNNEKALFPDTIIEDLDIKVDNDHVFQKGDNKNSITGMVPEDEIIGKVIFIF